MRDILKGIYYGEILPFWEHSFEDAEYYRKMMASIKADSELREHFPEAEKLIDAHNNARNDVEEIISYNQFLFGFRVGAQLMLEMMRNID